jgi:hypothetical protein
LELFFFNFESLIMATCTELIVFLNAQAAVWWLVAIQDFHEAMTVCPVSASLAFP